MRPDAKKWKKINKTDHSSIPSSVTIDIDDKGTVSSISTDADKKKNINRSLARSKQQVILLKKENANQHKQIGILKSQIKKVNSDLIKEKKTSNILLARSRAEAGKTMAAAKEILKESQMLKEIAKEKELQAKAKQTEAKQSNTIILRKERMKTCQQIKIRKEQVLQERKTNKELIRRSLRRKQILYGKKEKVEVKVACTLRCNLE